MTRRITLDLNPDHSRFLSQEKSRLRIQYGLKVNEQDILRTLVEQHRLRVLHSAEEDESIIWYYENLRRGHETFGYSPTARAATPITAETPSPPTGVSGATGNDEKIG